MSNVKVELIISYLLLVYVVVQKILLHAMYVYYIIDKYLTCGPMS